MYLFGNIPWLIVYHRLGCILQLYSFYLPSKFIAERDVFSQIFMFWFNNGWCYIDDDENRLIVAAKHRNWNWKRFSTVNKFIHTKLHNANSHNQIRRWYEETKGPKSGRNPTMKTGFDKAITVLDFGLLDFFIHLFIGCSKSMAVLKSTPIVEFVRCCLTLSMIFIMKLKVM